MVALVLRVVLWCTAAWHVVVVLLLCIVLWCDAAQRVAVVVLLHIMSLCATARCVVVTSLLRVVLWRCMRLWCVAVTSLLCVVSWRVAARCMSCRGMAWRGVVPGVLVMSLLHVMLWCDTAQGVVVAVLPPGVLRGQHCCVSCRHMLPPSVSWSRCYCMLCCGACCGAVRGCGMSRSRRCCASCLVLPQLG